MLDYVLSRMVLLIFLLLILGVITSYGEFLGDIFTSKSAKSLIEKIGEKIRSIALSLTRLEGKETEVLPPYIRAGPVRMDYAVVFVCEGSKLGIGVKDPKGTLLAFKYWDLKPPDRGIEIVLESREAQPGEIIEIDRTTSIERVTLTIRVKSREGIYREEGKKICQAS